jgi:hypothetical protein
VVTTTFAKPAEPAGVDAGVVAVSEVLLLTEMLVAAVPSMVTVVAPVTKFVPEMVTLVIPDEGPVAGEMPPNVGVAT